MSFLSSEPEVKVVGKADNLYNEIANLVSKCIHSRRGFKVLEIGCYTEYNIRGEVKGEITILSKLAKKFPNVLFAGVDPRMPQEFAKNEMKIYNNVILYPKYYLEDACNILKKSYGQFDLIYSINVLHLVDNINFHLQCIYDLLKHNGIFIAGWNLVGVPIAESIPRHKNQEIVNIVHRYFKRESSAVYVYHEWNHYHIFLLLILKK